VHFVGPAGADRKCVMCLMHAKQKQWEMYQAEIKAGNSASGEEVRWLAWLPGLDAEIFEAQYMAVPGDAPQLGIVPLCWDHVAGIGARPAVQHIAAPVPPGLLKGRG
jgi:hypothetical protein